MLLIERADGVTKQSLRKNGFEHGIANVRMYCEQIAVCDGLLHKIHACDEIADGGGNQFGRSVMRRKSQTLAMEIAEACDGNPNGLRWKSQRLAMGIAVCE